MFVSSNVIKGRDGVWVQGRGDVGAVRRRAREWSSGVDEVDAEAIALAATELATNLVEHTRSGGVVQLWATQAGFEVLSVDAGPRPSGSRPGLRAGLRTVAELSEELQLDVTAGGAVVRCRFGAAGEPALGFCSAPLRGYERSGDGVWFDEDARGWSAVLVDVLGHGPSASAERDRILDAVEALGEASAPEQVLLAAHEVCRGARGAALRWARVEGDTLRTFGVGNVGGLVAGGARDVRFDDQAGIVGRYPTAPRVREYPWSARSRLVMFSDGLSTRLVEANLDVGPVVAAGRMFRDASRGRDDALVLVVGGGPAPGAAAWG